MEILSPASNMNHIKIAIDHKANAVYGGLKKWNARNKAINFSDEEYNILIEELHKNGIKFFLTLNILMLDEEIEEIICFLKKNKLPDSFIVADIGLIQRLHKEFPNVPLHFSTQFGCHNIDDVNYIKSINGDRAILARELTLQEINKIKDNTDIELESFIWGSQCLSFSGLCFFGSFINGGGGNRGKCIITCRDVYCANGEKGHHLYVPDMDCTNLISKLDGIDCLKLEGRRRNPKEIANILDKINQKIDSKINVGYMYGTRSNQNNLYEKINSRIKPVMKASDLKNISNNDVLIEFMENKPIKFSRDSSNPNVMYVYTEIKNKYSLIKKNISFDVVFDRNKVKEILYVNYKGDGHTFFEGNNNDLLELNFDEIIKSLDNHNPNINLYKIKYIKNDSEKYFISKTLLNEVINYLVEDCKTSHYERIKNNKVIDKMYLETQDESIIEKYINDKFIKIIYDVSTINKLKNIDKFLDKYSSNIIYKLPIFNWKSDDLKPYLSLLEGQEIMFTRLSQIYLCKDINFKKKYVDYTIYVWNKNALNYLKENGIEEFTASPELNYETNLKIFDKENVQMILGGKLPLVYTRNCFDHIMGCSSCGNMKQNLKEINNTDKSLKFEILCNEDYRYILNKEPILNNYLTLDVRNNIKFRYVTIGQDTETIIETVEILKKENYYSELKRIPFWKDSYECNIEEGKD
ncbi:MAG: U32 family peptidase [Bacilli bacterium]|nr:U32 family peptidase [Bacilli bacterium]